MRYIFILQHVEREGPGLFKEIAIEKNYVIKTIKIYLGEMLPNPSSEDIILILGGPMGLNDIHDKRYPWLQKEINLIKYALKNNIAIIGVCLGAQLIAYTCGGNIEELRKGLEGINVPEVGWGKVIQATNDDESVFDKYIQKGFYALHWHGDRIILPKKAKLLASTEFCKEQFFQVGRNIFGIQFHVETTKGTIERWIKEDLNFVKSGLGPNGEYILLSEEERFQENSLLDRKNFIRDLFDQLLV